MEWRFKWHMFFTSFLPLWVSIVICDIWRLVEDGYYTMILSIKTPLSAQQTPGLIGSFLLNHGVEFSSVIILVVYSFICMLHVNKFIRNQENTTNKAVRKITKARRANKLTTEFLLAYILPYGRL